MSDREDDLDRGERRRRAMLGDDWVDRSLGGTTAFNADFQSLVTRHAWFDIWTRPGLDTDTRRLLVLGMTMGQGRWEEFELHCRAAVRGGTPVEKIRETLMQGAIYCGVPAANTAFKLAGKVLADEGRLPPPAPLTPAVRVRTHHTFSAPQLQVALQGPAGQGVPIVLAHALGADLHLWDDYAATLAAQGHEVLRYDQRGHGGSAVPAGSWSIDDLVDDAARLIAEWGRGPVLFVGLSMGGMVAQGLAIRHPALLRGVVVAHSVAAYGEAARAAWAERIAGVARAGVASIAAGTMERWFTPAFRSAHPDVVARHRATLEATDTQAYVQCARAIAVADFRAALPTVATPMLVVAGEHDAGAPPEAGREIAAAVPGAALQLLDAAHLGVLEQPQAFAAAVGTLLARCGG